MHPMPYIKVLPNHHVKMYTFCDACDKNEGGVRPAAVDSGAHRVPLGLKAEDATLSMTKTPS